MATNYNPYRRAGDGKPPVVRLNIKDIAVGDTLIRADWDYSPGRWAETEYTVTKVLKTRLVIKSTEPRNGRLSETRLLVDNGSWAHSKGNVSNNYEGMSEWSKNRYYMFTPNDLELERLREDTKSAAETSRITNTARAAAEHFTIRGQHTIENAQAAIAALKLFVLMKEAE
jgi:hypothetical protein